MTDLVPKLHSFVVLDSDGERLLAKYYDGRNKAAQTAYEGTLHKKTRLVPAKVNGMHTYRTRAARALHIHEHACTYTHTSPYSAPALLTPTTPPLSLSPSLPPCYVPRCPHSTRRR